MYKQETRSADIAKFFSKSDVILMDTCSLMEDAFPELMDELSDNDYWDGQITVLSQCIQELKKHAKGKDADKKIDAKRALKILRHDAWHGKRVRIEKKATKSLTNFADRVLYNLVNMLRADKRVLVITQDKKLAYDLRQLNHLGSQHGHPVEVYKLIAGGDLAPNYGADENGLRANAEGEVKPISGRRPSRSSDLFHRSAPPKPSIELEPILEEDKRLSSNLPNANYPVARKLEDIEAQIARLNAYKDSSKLRLAYTVGQLEAERKRLKESKTAPTSNKPVTPAPVSKTPPKEVAKPVPLAQTKPAEKPKAASKPADKPKPKPYAEKGRNASFAFERLGEHYGWLFRDASIPYNRMVHGDYDLTSKDLAQMDNLASHISVNSETDLYFRSLVVHVSRDENFFYVSKVDPSDDEPEAHPTTEKPKIVAKPQPSSKQKSKVTPKKEAAKPLPSGPAKPSKKASSAKPAAPSRDSAKKEASSIKADTPKKPSKPASKVSQTPARGKPVKTSQNGLAAVPDGVTLYVGGPKVKTLSKPAASEKSVAPFKTPKPAPAPKTGKGKAASAPSLTTTEKAITNKPAKGKASSPSVTPLRRAEAKPSPKPASTDRAVTAFDAASKADKNLHRNLNNPNYPKEKKINDIKAQIALIRGLKPSEARKLLYGLRSLEQRLKELEPTKKR